MRLRRLFSIRYIKLQLQHGLVSFPTLARILFTFLGMRVPLSSSGANHKTGNTFQLTGISFSSTPSTNVEVMQKFFVGTTLPLYHCTGHRTLFHMKLIERRYIADISRLLLLTGNIYNIIINHSIAEQNESGHL